MSTEANWVSKVLKWTSVLAVVFASLWVGGLAYFAQAFTTGAIDRINASEIDVSLATAAVAINWPVLIVLSLLYLLTATFLSYKVKVNPVFHLVIAISAIITACAINILVVSAGFELNE